MSPTARWRFRLAEGVTQLLTSADADEMFFAGELAFDTLTFDTETDRWVELWRTALSDRYIDADLWYVVSGAERHGPCDFASAKVLKEGQDNGSVAALVSYKDLVAGAADANSSVLTEEKEAAASVPHKTLAKSIDEPVDDSINLRFWISIAFNTSLILWVFGIISNLLRAPTDAMYLGINFGGLGVILLGAFLLFLRASRWAREDKRFKKTASINAGNFVIALLIAIVILLFIPPIAQYIILTSFYK